MITQETFGEYSGRPALNASTLSLLLPPGSPKLLNYRVESGIGPDEDTVRVGTAFHSLVELLPLNVFSERFAVLDDWRNHPENKTGWNKKTGEFKSNAEPSTSKTAWSDYQEWEQRKQLEGTGKEILQLQEQQRIVRLLQAVSNNGDAMNLIVNCDSEVTVSATIHGVDCKGRVDGLSSDGSVVIDMKCLGGGVDARAFRRADRNLHYTFKDAFRLLLLRENGLIAREFKYILLHDVPRIEKGEHKGKFRKPSDCVVVDVPMTVFESLEDTVMQAIGRYRECVRTGEWPGIEPYQYVPDMADEIEPVKWGA